MCHKTNLHYPHVPLSIYLCPSIHPCIARTCNHHTAFTISTACISCRQLTQRNMEVPMLMDFTCSCASRCAPECVLRHACLCACFTQTLSCKCDATLQGTTCKSIQLINSCAQPSRGKRLHHTPKEADSPAACSALGY